MSLCVVYFFSSFFFLLSFLCDSWQWVWLFSRGCGFIRRWEGWCIWISGQPSDGICTEEERNTNKRDQRHRAVFVVESANIRVVSSVQNIVCYCCSFFPYFSIPATPKEQWGKDGLMEGKGLWGNLHLRVGPRSLLLSVLPWAPHWFLCLPYPIPAGGGTTLQCDTWVQVFLPWHITAAAVINITWCGPYHLGSNGLFLNAFIMTHWPGMIVCPPSGGVCQHDSTLSLALSFLSNLQVVL